MYRIVLILISFALESVVLAGPAAATLPGPGSGSGVCSGQNQSHLVKRYYPVAWGNGHVPLRCGRWDGSSGWGYRKLLAKGRWNIWYDGMIGATMHAPTKVTHEGTSTAFRTQWFTNCSPVYRFVVIVESRRTPQGVARGIITAYQEVRK
jgi:hypothetical protein